MCQAVSAVAWAGFGDCVGQLPNPGSLMGASFPFHQHFFFFFTPGCFSALQFFDVYQSPRGGRLGSAPPLQEMSRKSLVSLRFEPEMHLQSRKWYFVTMATELLKKRMSSNMRIPVLMATAILHILGRKCVPPSSCL